MSAKKVVVAGGGVLGSQIAYQAAFKGFDTTIWLRSEGSIGRTEPKLQLNYKNYIEELEKTKAMLGTPMGAILYPKGIIDDYASMTPEKIDELESQAKEALGSLKLELDMEKAFEDADIIIESMTENPQDKIAFYQKAAPYLPEKTILCTNSSTMLPSTFAEYTGRPNKYLALHFANNIFKNNTAEIMGHEGTDQKNYDEVVEFAQELGMVPLKLKKEQPGYLLNTMLVPFLSAAQMLWANDVADFKTIDTTWKLATGAPLGPFQIIDIVGLKTCYDIVSMRPDAADPESDAGKILAGLKKKMDKGETGVAAGKGFYDYTNK